MELHVDHVTFGGTDLDAIRERLDDAGIATEYGGGHVDGTTHMATAVLRDGSYLEAIAPTEGTDPADAGYWPAHLAGDAGPAAWCVRPGEGRDVSDVACDAIRSGFEVAGPTPGGRTTTDDRDLEWDAVVIRGDRVDPFPSEGAGGGAGGEALPFACADRTPRDWRVDPAHVHEGPIAGVETVLVAVEEASPWTRRFRRLANVGSPVRMDLPEVTGTVHAFPGAPLALVEAADGSALSDRVNAFGPGPCGYLLRVADVTDARESYPLTDSWSWLQDRGAWIEGEAGVLGVVGN